MSVTISTKNAPAAIGPYVQAKKVGQFLFTSGQIALDADGNDFTHLGVAEQAAMALNNLEQVLIAGGSSRKQVIKTTIFLVSMDDFHTVNEVYGAFFGENPPARSTVAVKELPKGASIELECIALVE